MVGSPEDNDAGPMLRLNNGGHVWTHTLDISDSKLSSLSLVLSQVQEKLNPGVEVQVTEQEFAKFMEMVFDDWTTSDLHYMARLNSIIPSMNDIGFRFGFLREAAPASAGESGKRKPRARAMQKQEASKVTKTKHAHRQAGSPVWFMVEISNGIPGITLRDSKCWMLSANTPVQTAGNTIEDAMFKAMKRHDGFYVSTRSFFLHRTRLISIRLVLYIPTTSRSPSLSVATGSSTGPMVRTRTRFQRERSTLSLWLISRFVATLTA